VLEQFINFFKSNQPETDWWDEISDHEKEMIRQGEASVKNGKLHTNEEVIEMAKSILKGN
jgi:predicted transcriptional regulator